MAFNSTATRSLILLGITFLPLVLSIGVNHSLILGRYSFGDKLLFFNATNIRGGLFHKTYHTIKYPSNGHFSTANITYISIIDLKRDGTGGYPYIISGGIGKRNVTIGLESQRGHGLHFNVTLYGR